MTYGYYEILDMKRSWSNPSNKRYDLWILNTVKSDKEKYEKCKDAPCFWDWDGNNDGRNGVTGFVRWIEYDFESAIVELYEGEMIDGIPNGFGRFIKPGYFEMFIGNF